MRIKSASIILSCISLLFCGCVQSGHQTNSATIEQVKPVHVNSSRTRSSSYNSSNSSSNKAAYGVVKKYDPNEDSPVISGDGYRVRAGDTLYSIAFKYGKDYRQVAKRNNIEAPYNITVGQVIYFDDKETSQTVKTAVADTKKPVPYAELEKDKKQPKSVASAKTESDIYVVKNGDSVMSVSRKTGVSFSNIIKYNKLKKPYALYTGQKLHLKDDGSLKKTSATVDTEVVKTNKEVAKTVPVAGAETGERREDTAYVEVPATSTRVVSGKSKEVSGVRWMWPAKGKVVANFSSVNKGVDIAGTRGQDVNAAADGQVVYSGNALRGYGNLIIINHNNEFLSAYAHNDMLLVKEGQKVKRGQVIAKMGSTDTSSVKLHFEIRYKGNSVNPRKYLP